MFIILLCTVTGFLAGMALVMMKRRISPNKILSSTFAGLTILTILKLIKDYKDKRKHF